jgi:DNA polymerase-3 subunit epsilon
MTILFFDTETTGLPDFRMPPDWEGQPRICQLGAILTDAEGKVKAEMNLIMRPDGYLIPRSASDIHGITHEDAIKYGVSIKGALMLFSRLISKAERVVAHNIGFDQFMIEREAIACEFYPKDFMLAASYCTMENSRAVVRIPPTEKMTAAGFTDFKNPNLQECHKHFFGREFDGAHDAMADVRACRDVYFAIQKQQRAAA